MPVAEYMSRCLWDDEHGYYATRSVIGSAGDFITAAEISQVFGELIGLWSAVVWQQVLGSPPAVTLVEVRPWPRHYDARRVAGRPHRSGFRRRGDASICSK